MALTDLKAGYGVYPYRVNELIGSVSQFIINYSVQFYATKINLRAHQFNPFPGR
jgi:hypothetical protein